MARLSRDESQAQTREKLLAAGRTLVVDRGFAGASVRDIAEAAGFSQGAFYSNFEGKEGLLLELCRQHKQGELAGFEAVMQTDPSGLLDALDAWAEGMAARTEWAVLAVELELHAARNAEFGVKYHEMMRLQFKTMADIIMRLFRHMGGSSPIDLEELSQGLVALTHGLGVQAPPISAPAWRRVFGTFVRGIVALALANGAPRDAVAPRKARS